MTPAMNGKKDFLDDVVDNMGDDAPKYGAESEDEADPMDDESAGEDQMMAVKTLGKALGIQIADPGKVAAALKAFVATC